MKVVRKTPRTIILEEEKRRQFEQRMKGVIIKPNQQSASKSKIDYLSKHFNEIKSMKNVRRRPFNQSFKNKSVKRLVSKLNVNLKAKKQSFQPKTEKKAKVSKYMDIKYKKSKTQSNNVIKRVLVYNHIIN